MGEERVTHTLRIIDVSNTERFSSFLGFRASIRRPITKDDIKTLSDELYHRRIFKFKRGAIIQRGINHCWSCDLAEFPANRQGNH